MPDISSTLNEALSNPNVQNYLHMLASAEGTAHAADPYAVGFGGTTFDNLSQHPNVSHSFTQTDGTKSTTTAAGAYQIIKPTWDGIQKALNLPDFGPQSQDIGAVYLMRQNGSLQDVINGDYQTAIQKDGKTWASLPTSTAAQPKRSQEFVSQALAQGPSGSGATVSNANAAETLGANAADFGSVSAPKLLDAYHRAEAAKDSEAMQQLAGALGPRIEQGLRAAQAANDTDAVNQLRGMLGQIGWQGSNTAATINGLSAPSVSQRQGTPAVTAKSVTSDEVGPPASAKPKSTWQQLTDGVSTLASEAINHPTQLAGNIATSIGQGVANFGQHLVTNPLKTADDSVRGVADFLTFGTADKLAALANSQKNGTAYEDELLKQRQQDEAGGAAFKAGQLGAVFVPGVGELSLAKTATQAVPTASKAVRMLAGAGAGAAEGAANYVGHSDGAIDAGDLGTNAALGAALGPLAGSGGPTEAQRSATFLRQFGGGAANDSERVANAQRSAEVIQGLQNLQNRATQGAAALGPADANALAGSYTQQAEDALKQMGNTPEQQTLLSALSRSRSLNDDDLAALRQLPNGKAVADAIQMRQQVQALTAATPASTGTIASGLRMAVDNGALGAVGHAITPGLGFVLDSKPIRTLAIGALGGRENRTGNIADLLNQATNARAFLSVNGGSQASQSARALAQAAQSAQTARVAATQAGVTSNANAYATGYFNRGIQAAQQARVMLAQGPAQRAAQAQAALQALQAQQTRNALTASTRMPLGGGYQTLLEGGASGLNLTSTEANQGLRALANHPVLGNVANEMRQTGGVADPAQFYALQNGLRALKERGYIGSINAPPNAPAVSSIARPTAEPSLSGAIRNAAAYSATVARNQKMVDSAVQHAPSPQLAVVAHQMGTTSSPEMKQQAFDAVMAKASPSERVYLKTHVAPLIRYGS